MSKNCSVIEGKPMDDIQAKNWEASGGFVLKPIQSLAAKRVKREPVPDAAEALGLTCPNPNQGIQPLSGYLLQKVTKRVIKHMKRMCQERGNTLDLDYWGSCTRTILNQDSADEAIIIPAPAGAGKSTWIEAFTLAIVELFSVEPELSVSLVGVTVVLQKVADLNRLAGILNVDTEEDQPNMVALQGWSKSGQQLGFCENPDVKDFEDCQPASCPYANRCKLLTFREQAVSAPIIGLTQERFLILRDSGQLSSVLDRIGTDGHLHPRRYLIFDEKFQMAQINVLDKNTIDEASKELTQLIQKKGVSDQQVRYFQQRLSYLIDRPYQQLRSKLRLEIHQKMEDIQIGFCDMKDAEFTQKMAYKEFRTSVLERNKKFATKNLRMAFAVMDKLYSGEPCIFSKMNGFAVASILPPVVRYGQCQSLIFDATAEVDQDYSALERVQWMEKKPKQSPCQVRFHIYTHRDLDVSKRAMSAPWKITVFSRLIAEKISALKVDAFVCSYKNQAEMLAEALKDEMQSNDFDHVLLMDDKEWPTLPYLDGTNGSNQFHKSEAVFMIGYPRLNPWDYLIHTCAAYGPDNLYDALQEIPLEQLTRKSLNMLYSIPSVQKYVAHHLAARLEQEIFRSAIRKSDFKGTINIYLFYPPTDMLRILNARIRNTSSVTYYDDPPQYVALCKSKTRQYGGGPTNLARPEQFIKEWSGEPVSSAKLREHLGLSPDVWKDLVKNEKFELLLAEYGVERYGRGRNCVYRIPGAECT